MTDEEFNKELELALAYSTETWADIVCVSSAFVQHLATLKAQLDPVIKWVEEVAEGLDSIRNANDNITVLTAKAIEERDSLRAQLAAMTAERDQLKAQLDAVPVRAIDFYFFHVDEEVAMIDADIPGNPEAMVNAAVQIGDWLNSTRR